MKIMIHSAERSEFSTLDIPNRRRAEDINKHQGRHPVESK